MKMVRLDNNVVAEIIPEYGLPVEKWYGAAFAAKCVEAPDEVERDWIYDPETESWAKPSPITPEPDPIPEPTTEDRVSALEAENKILKAQVSAQSDQLDFYEDCIAEMASIVYA